MMLLNGIVTPETDRSEPLECDPAEPSDKTNNQMIEKDFRMATTRIQSLLSVVLPLALVGCAVGEAGTPPPAPPAPEVTTASVVISDLNDWADFTGRLEAVE